MSLKCAFNNKHNKYNNNLLDTIVIILLSLVIFWGLYNFYNKSSNKNIDRFADTINDKQWTERTVYKINPSTYEVKPTTENVNKGGNLDTDKYLAMDNVTDSKNPATTDSSSYEKLDLKALNEKLIDENNNINNVINILRNINDSEKLYNDTQLNSNSKLADILTDEIAMNIYDNLNKQNNMAYKLLLQDNYNSMNIVNK